MSIGINKLLGYLYIPIYNVNNDDQIFLCFKFMF